MVGIDTKKKRKWSIKIFDMNIENLIAEDVDIFICFQLGHNRVFEDRINHEGIKIERFTGGRGKQFTSDLYTKIKKDTNVNIDINIAVEREFSYEDLRKKDFFIQVWRYGKWTVNQLAAEKKIPLIMQASGSITRSEGLGIDNVKKAARRSFKQNFSCQFEEIWDYKFKLLDVNQSNWSPFYTTSSSRVEFKLGKTILKTHQIETDSTMSWEEVEGTFIYTGTMSGLRNKKLKCNIYEHTKGHTKGRGKCITLLTLEDNIFLTTILKQRKEELINSDKLTGIGFNFGSKSGVAKTKGHTTKKTGQPSVTNRPSHGVSRKSFQVVNTEKEDVLSDGITFAKLNVMAVFESGLPRFIQKSTFVPYQQDKCYQAIDVGRIDLMNVPDSIGIVNSYVQVEWNSQVRETAIQKDSFTPNFKQTLLFRIDFMHKFRKALAGDIKEKQEIMKELNDILLEGSEINISVWLDSAEGQLKELSGTVKILLDQYRNREIDVHNFFDCKKNKKIIVKVWSIQDDMKCYCVQNPDLAMTIGLTQSLQPTECFTPMDENGTWITDFDIFDKPKNQILFDPLVRTLMKQQGKNTQFQDWSEDIRTQYSEAENQQRTDNYEKIFYLTPNEEEQIPPCQLQPYHIEHPKLTSLYGLAHYVHCFPFNDNESNLLANRIITTPNYMMIKNQGTALEHAILLACVLMGIRETKEQIEQYKYPIPIRDRVFVCIGLNNKMKKVFWVMTFSDDLSTVTLWDPKTNDHYDLKGRVPANEVHELSILLQSNGFYRWDPDQRNRDMMEELDPDQVKMEVGDDKKNLLGDDLFDDGEAMRKRDELRRQLIEKILDQDDKRPELSDFLVDENIKRKMEKDNARINNQPGNKNNVSKAALKKMGHGDNDKKSPIEAVNRFEDTEGNDVRGVEVPFWSVEILFNRKNCFGNQQNFKPNAIHYNLHNDTKWKSLLNVNIEGEQWIWCKPIGNTFAPSKVKPVMKNDYVKNLEKRIFDDIKFTIECARSALNLETKIRNKFGQVFYFHFQQPKKTRKSH